MEYTLKRTSTIKGNFGKILGERSGLPLTELSPEATPGVVCGSVRSGTCPESPSAFLKLQEGGGGV